MPQSSPVLSSAFGRGIVVSNVGKADTAWDIIVLPSGKFLVAGNVDRSYYYVARYLADGRLDTSFGANGVALGDIDTAEAGYSMAVQADGKILIAGGINKPQDL